jgi:ribosomal protein S1
VNVTLVQVQPASPKVRVSVRQQLAYAVKQFETNHNVFACTMCGVVIAVQLWVVYGQYCL